MKHEQQRDRRHEDLCAYLLGELEAPERARVEAALAESAEWRAERDRIEATFAAVRELASGGASLSDPGLSDEAQRELVARAAALGVGESGAGQEGVEAAGDEAASDASVHSETMPVGDESPRSTPATSSTLRALNGTELAGAAPLHAGTGSPWMRAAAAIALLTGGTLLTLEWLTGPEESLPATEESAQAPTELAERAHTRMAASFEGLGHTAGELDGLQEGHELALREALRSGRFSPSTDSSAKTDTRAEQLAVDELAAEYESIQPLDRSAPAEESAGAPAGSPVADGDDGLVRSADSLGLYKGPGDSVLNGAGGGAAAEALPELGQAFDGATWPQGEQPVDSSSFVGTVFSDEVEAQSGLSIVDLDGFGSTLGEPSERAVPPQELGIALVRGIEPSAATPGAGGNPLASNGAPRSGRPGPGASGPSSPGPSGPSSPGPGMRYSTTVAVPSTATSAPNDLPASEAERLAALGYNSGSNELRGKRTAGEPAGQPADGSQVFYLGQSAAPQPPSQSDASKKSKDASAPSTPAPVAGGRAALRPIGEDADGGEIAELLFDFEASEAEARGYAGLETPVLGRPVLRYDTGLVGIPIGELLERIDRGEPIFDRLHAKGLHDDDLRRIAEHEARRRLRDCRPRPNEHPRDMFYRFWGDNAFETARFDPLSTFSVDVDTASYVLARNYVRQGHLPTKAQVRTEEFLNYFDADLAPPLEDDFAIHTELAPSLFGGRPDRMLLRVGVRAREVSREERLPLSLTFVIDTSGSMKEGQRLELVKNAVRLLIAELDGRDHLALVAFSGEARLILPMTSAANRGVIEVALEQLRPDGSTNADAGLRMGYELAGAEVLEGRNHRVVLFSDGVANTGETDQHRILESVRHQSERGVYLNTVGVGMNNHNDTFLEQLADRGDGICDYVDDLEAARRAVVERFTSAFEPVASDVKIQVQFDPRQVARYRLLGYENRAIADADFRNDAVDAGEIGAGHQVIALYELERSSIGATDAPLATVRLRWLPPKSAGIERTEDGGFVMNTGLPGPAREIAANVGFDRAAASFHAASQGYRLSTLVAQYAEFLRRSAHARGDSYQTLMDEADRLAAETREPDVIEFAALVREAARLVVQASMGRGEIDRLLDEYRREQLIRCQLERLSIERDEALLDDLRERNDELEQRLRDLMCQQLRSR